MTKTKKVFLFASFALSGWSNVSTVSAQTAYYREVYYKVDTVYNKAVSNRIEVNVGGQADFNGDASGVNTGYYGYGRVHVSRFMFSGLVSMMPGTDYNVQEATAVYCFGGTSEIKPGDKAIVHSDDLGTTPTQFKTGGKNKYISPQSYSYKTSKEDVSYRGPTANAPGGSKVTTTTTTTHSGTTNAVTKYKNTCWLNVPKHTTAGLSGGVFHWVRPNDISGVVNVTGISFGLVASVNQKAKYRFHYEERENDVEILGLGKYNTTKTDRIHRKGTKMGRVNSTVDVGLEFLFAPVVIFDNNQYMVKTANDTIGHLEDIKKKNFGGRIRMEIRKGPISMRYEIGLRPGVKAKIGGASGEDNFATRRMGGAYIIVGFGLGIGVL